MIEINWIKNEVSISEDNKEDAYLGYVGFIQVCEISQDKGDNYYYSHCGRGNDEIFHQGTLEQCKQNAINLINKRLN